MITGDQAATATAVARELRLSRRGSLESIEASELATLPPGVLRGRVRDVGIFARVQPEQKLAIVRALQEGGDVVAMTGDGVNDAAALRAADVGVAMGQSGTELARELADVVLSTDDFARFVDAVEEGRLVRCNVQRVLHYLLATNASEVWTVGGSVALGLASPLTPLQLLWLNLISDVGPAVGLATEPAPPDLMTRPPRDPKEPLVSVGLRRRILGESLAISLGALGVYGLGVLRYGPGPVAQTMAFAALTGSQLLHVPLARTGDRPADAGGVPYNPKLAWGVGVSVLLQVGAVFFPPLRAALGGAAIGLGDALIALVGSLLPIAGIHAVRALSAPPPRRRLLPPASRRAQSIHVV
jgi:Ca2+-transporting ATPase